MVLIVTQEEATIMVRPGIEKADHYKVADLVLAAPAMRDALQRIKALASHGTSGICDNFGRIADETLKLLEKS